MKPDSAQQIKEDLEFVKGTEAAWKEIDNGKFTNYSTEEYFKKIMKVAA